MEDYNDDDISISHEILLYMFLTTAVTYLILLRHLANGWMMFKMVRQQGLRLLTTAFLLEAAFGAVHSIIILLQKTDIFNVECKSRMLGCIISMILCTFTITGSLFQRTLRSSPHSKIIYFLCLVWMSVSIYIGIGYYTEARIEVHAERTCIIRHDPEWLITRLFTYLFVLITFSGIYFSTLKTIISESDNLSPNSIVIKEGIPTALYVTLTGIIVTMMAIWNSDGNYNNSLFAAESAITSTFICLMLRNDGKYEMREKERQLSIEKNTLLRVSTGGPIVFGESTLPGTLRSATLEAPIYGRPLSRDAGLIGIANTNRQTFEYFRPAKY
ncbi:hypothetical protein BDF19DRAFT_462724 [Syncephalis fuscata]|nr:hypothetical protein BDF19DRAFT_462724 [Syncephalis fuscata]